MRKHTKKTNKTGSAGSKCGNIVTKASLADNATTLTEPGPWPDAKGANQSSRFPFGKIFREIHEFIDIGLDQINYAHAIDNYTPGDSLAQETFLSWSAPRVQKQLARFISEYSEYEAIEDEVDWIANGPLLAAVSFLEQICEWHEGVKAILRKA